MRYRSHGGVAFLFRGKVEERGKRLVNYRVATCFVDSAPLPNSCCSLQNETGLAWEKETKGRKRKKDRNSRVL